MTVTIETINGKQFTVVWHMPKGWAEERDCDVIDTALNSGLIALTAKYMGTHIATALPALPRHPKPEHGRLLHLYAAHGVGVLWEFEFTWGLRESLFVGTQWGKLLFERTDNSGDCYFYDPAFPITHLTYNNQRIDDFAIEDETNEPR